MKPFYALLGLGIALIPSFALSQGLPGATTVKDILSKPLPKPPAELFQRIGDFLGRAWGFVSGIISWQDLWNFLQNFTRNAIEEGKASFERGRELLQQLFNIVETPR